MQVSFKILFNLLIGQFLLNELDLLNVPWLTLSCFTEPGVSFADSYQLADAVDQILHLRKANSNSNSHTGEKVWVAPKSWDFANFLEKTAEVESMF